MTVGVVGGGTMGRDIAYVHLAAGHDVVLVEADGARLAAAVAAVRGHFARRATPCPWRAGRCRTGTRCCRSR